MAGALGVDRLVQRLVEVERQQSLPLAVHAAELALQVGHLGLCRDATAIEGLA